MKKTYTEPRTSYEVATPEVLLANSSDTPKLNMDNEGTNANPDAGFLSRDNDGWDEEW